MPHTLSSLGESVGYIPVSDSRILNKTTIVVTVPTSLLDYSGYTIRSVQSGESFSYRNKTITMIFPSGNVRLYAVTIVGEQSPQQQSSKLDESGESPAWQRLLELLAGKAGPVANAIADKKGLIGIIDAFLGNPATPQENRDELIDFRAQLEAMDKSQNTLIWVIAGVGVLGLLGALYFLRNK
jgi:hypothetical protein